MEYVLSVGTNIGDRKKNIQNAVDALDLIPKTKVSAVSDIYETEPVGYAQQDDFYNAVIKVQSDLEPNEMLGVCLGIEAGLGRERKVHWGPRIIDIDLIFDIMNFHVNNIISFFIDLLLMGLFFN